MADYLLDRERMPSMPHHFNRVNVSYNFSSDQFAGVFRCLNTSPISSSSAFSSDFNSSSNDSRDRLSSQNVYRLVVDVGIVGTLCLFGFVGSTLTIVTLRFDKEKNNTTTWLLQVLAVVDILYLAACIFIQPLKTIYTLRLWRTDEHLQTVQPHLESYTWYIASVIQTIMIWVVILVTTDRYLAICKPLNCHKLRTIQKCQIAVCAVVLLAVLYNIPLLFERQVITSRDLCTGKVISKTRLTDLRNDRLYFLVYKTLCYLTFRSLGPLLTLIALNSKLLAALRELRSRRRSLTRLCSHGENVTTMLVVVVSVFVVCELPDCCLRLATILQDYVHSKALDEDVIRLANVIANMLHTFNASVNFLIYCLIGRKFRRILSRLCCGSSPERSVQEDDIELRMTTNQSAGNNPVKDTC